MIEQSVGLMGGELSWLALEGLIRQQTNFKWELLVSDKSPDIYKKYLSDLRKANCVQVKVYPDLKPDKFKTVVDPNSRVLVIVNHDTFSHFSRLQESKDVKEVIYTDYQLSYSPAKKTFIQITDRLNYAIPLKEIASGGHAELNRDGFVVRKTTAPYLYQDEPLAEKAPDLVEKINNIKDIYTTVHFVYVYINPEMGGPVWQELYYSVKSIQKFFKGLPYRIFVVGDQPKIKGVTHVPCERVKHKINAKNFDATKKLLKIIDTPEINDDFIYMYDDIVLLKQLTIDDFLPVMAIDLVLDTKKYWSRGRIPSKEWITPFNNTIVKLGYHKLPTYNYETHLPRFLNKDKVKHIISRYDLEHNAYMFSTLYFNTYHHKPDIILRDSVNIKADGSIPYESHNIEKFMKGRKFLNYNDAGLNDVLQKYIRGLLL